MIKINIVISLLFLCINAKAHSDYYLIREFDNVVVRFQSGFDYEEMNKVMIYGQLCSYLADSLQYKKPIYLQFNHTYTSRPKTDYFISFDNGSCFQSEKNESFSFSKNVLVVRQVGVKFDSEETLKLVQFAIQNKDGIKNQQQFFHYKRNYTSWRINSIDSTSIDSIVKSNSSDLIRNILELEVERLAPNESKYLSYSWSNKKFQIFMLDYQELRTDLLELSDIFYIKYFNDYSAVFFDTDSSFYYLSHSHMRNVSIKHSFDKPLSAYRPPEIKQIGKNKVFINLQYIDNQYETVDITMVYLIDQDVLIPEFDLLIEEYKD